MPLGRKTFHFYSFIEVDISYRHAFNLVTYTTLAYQAKLGLVTGYTTADRVHPDKQYTIGGHGIVRAWDRQMFGPGLYQGDKKEERKKLIGKTHTQSSAQLKPNGAQLQPTKPMDTHHLHDQGQSYILMSFICTFYIDD